MKKKVLIVIILTLISLIIVNETKEMIVRLSNKQDVEDIKTVDILKNKKQTIAVMVQQDDNTWRAIENRNAWPSSTTHGFVGSKCYDGNGALVDSNEIVSFDLSTYTATINTTNSIYCTLYFAKGTTALELLQEKGGSTFAGGGNHTTAVDGLYRFKGTYSQVNNNYICFGTSDKEECLKSPNEYTSSAYMYRIIGITSEDDNTVGLKKGQLKIIKLDPASRQVWASGSQTWDSSNVKNYLTSWYDTNIAGLTPNGEYWDSLVTSQKWYNVNQTSKPGNIEPKGSQSAASKVALMYATDYINAYGEDTSNWLFSYYRWTMSRYGPYDGSYATWGLWQKATLVSQWSSAESEVNPVMFLRNGVSLSGTGISTDPFIISGVMPQD